jgi:hypothetical protein
MIEQIHFRTTLDVTAESRSVGLPELIWEITAWIRGKEGPTARLKAPWALRQGTWRKADGRAVVNIDSIVDASGELESWALRYSHHDAEFAARHWTIDIGIVPLAARRWRFALNVGNSLLANFMGQEPRRLPVTPPRLMKTLMGSPKWKCWSGDVLLSNSVTTVAVGSAHVLRDLIERPGRGCAVVYVSRSQTTGEPLIDASRLAASIAGSGVVLVAASVDVDEELEYLIPFEFRAPNGMVRVYAPGAILSDTKQSFRHRFFTRQQIEAAGPQEIEQQIARSLAARSGWARVQTTVTSIDDVRVARREARRAELRSQDSVESSKELLSLYEQSIEELTEQLATKSKERDAAEQGAEEAALQAEELRDRLRMTEFERETFRSDAVEAKRRTAALAASVATARSIRELPSTVAGVVALIAKLHGDSIVFAERALEAAKIAALDELGDGAHIAWRHLHAAATVLPRLAFEENVSAGALPTRFREASGGIELSMTEGKATKADAKLVGARTISFDGRSWDIGAHIKFGTKAPRLLRVHFALDRENRRVIIGHCGDHLATAGTRRRG